MASSGTAASAPGYKPGLPDSQILSDLSEMTENIKPSTSVSSTAKQHVVSDELGSVQTSILGEYDSDNDDDVEGFDKKWLQPFAGTVTFF